MIRVNLFFVTAVLVGLLAPPSGLRAWAAEAPSAPVMTVWRMFGIPQGMRRVRDAASNRFGRHPNLERTDAMLRIADPANLESDIPALRVAAEAKANADQTAQKVKAIRYLAKVGCECSSQSDMVEEALLAALDDCVVEVRYEAAVALCETTGRGCGQCNRKSCCSVESLRKLHEVATGRDDNGCWRESSPDVRRAAGSAFDRCRRGFDDRPTLADPLASRETREQPHEAEGPLEVEPDAEPVEPGEERESIEERESVDAELEELLSAPSTGMASSLGAASGPRGTGLYMIGDYLGQSGGKVVVGYPYEIEVPIPPATFRSVKISENYSSIPRDRFFFNYSCFSNTVLGTGGRVSDVNRFVLGVEKTYYHDLNSLELRIPFGATVNSDQRTDGADFTNVEFGNVVLIGKEILHQTSNYALAGGLGIGFPTADDTRILDNNTLLVQVDNDAYHLAPFLGVATTPSENFFMESFVQVDVAVNQNDVAFHNGSQAGRLQDQAVLFADLSMGYWLYREPLSGKKLKGLAPTVEIHYSTSLTDADSLGDPRAGDFVTVGDGNRFDYMNMTFGAHCVLAHGGTVSPAVVVPVFGGDRRQFDYELQLQVNLPY